MPEAGLSHAVKKFKGRSSRSTPERRSHDQAQAEAWLREGIAAMGLAPAEVRELPGSDPRKVALVRLLRERTAVGQAWIAGKLGMGGSANVSQQIRRAKNTKVRQKLPAEL